MGSRVLNLSLTVLDLSLPWVLDLSLSVLDLSLPRVLDLSLSVLDPSPPQFEISVGLAEVLDLGRGFGSRLWF